MNCGETEVALAKVAVALSGGVDSAVSALLLSAAGHQIVGLSLQLGHGPDQAPEHGAQVARQLGIEHHVVPVAAQFARQVVAPAISAYAAGLTPNPCAWCNARVKLPLLWAAARDLGCQALATGHYARLVPGSAGPLLAMGRDARKSQAYFLARVSADLLPCLLFPLGELTKPQVREMAKKAGLAALSRPESQDGCFLPPGGWDQLMAEHQALKPGVVEDREGHLLARHQGLHRFTVGQRRGLGVAKGLPLYVLSLDGMRAAVKVGPEQDLWVKGLRARDARWFAPLAEAGDLKVRIRYAHQGVECKVDLESEGVKVVFRQPQRAVAPGQLAVFFEQDRVLGSAWITEPIS